MSSAKCSLDYFKSQARVMGILNCTPDSFFDGGVHSSSTEQVLKRALQLEADGADLIDLGAQSTRPGSVPISEDEEKQRLEVLSEMCRCVEIPISLDTDKASIAAWGIEQGVSVINDVTALRGDSNMIKVLADSDVMLVLMHAQGTPETMQDDPQYDDVLDDICDFFEERLEYVQAHGIDVARVILDPGIGFGKTSAHNLQIVKDLKRLKSFSCPILLGASRKRMIGDVLNVPVDERLVGTLAVNAWGLDQGVHCLRVHDVKETRQLLDMRAAIQESRT